MENELTSKQVTKAVQRYARSRGLQPDANKTVLQKVAVESNKPVDTKAAKASLKRAAKLQEKYWEELTKLETALGVAVDSTQELRGLSVEDLLELAEPDEDNDEPLKFTPVHLKDTL